MGGARRKFGQDFRGDAVRLVRETGRPVARVAPDLGVSGGTLGNWVNAGKRRRGGGNGVLAADERAELARLRREDAGLTMAMAVRGGQVPGVIMHAGQGSEYTARLVRQACTRLGIRQSMGRPGSALDNAVTGSWHPALEFELRRVEHFTTRAQARPGAAAWIEDCNQHRRHSPLQMMSPADFEQALRAGTAARDGPASPPPGTGRCSSPSRSFLSGQRQRPLDGSYRRSGTA